MTILGKAVVTLIIIAIIGIAGFALYKTTKPVTTPAPVVTENPPKTNGISPLVTKDESTAYTEIHLSYPHSSNSENPEIFTLVNGTRNDFLGNYGSLTDGEAQNMGISTDSPYQLFITTQVATSTKSVSYILQTYEFTGGAHGNTDVSTFTYDSTGKLVTLDQVFKPNYLKTIADLSRKYFYKTIEKDYLNKTMIDAGTVATTTNFSSWYLTDNTVTFIFGQYQIGPYVLGIVEYPIPKSSIQDILLPEFQ